MSQAIVVPQLGVSVTEATVLAWHVQEGDDVVADQLVCEISTDKVDTEVRAPVAGTIREILVAAGETAPVGAPLALLGSQGARVAEEVSAAVDSNGTLAHANPRSNVRVLGPGIAVLVAPASGGGAPIDVTTSPERYDHAAQMAATVPAAPPVRSSPVARRIAAANGLDLLTVAGSGRNGRVRKADVLARLADVASTAPSPSVAEVALTNAERSLPKGYEDVPHEIVETSPVRRAIAEHMSRSRHTAAHMTTEVDVDMQRVTEARAELNSPGAAGRRKLSYLPFVVRAACSTLLEFPDLNATFEGERLIRWREINIGIAVDTDRGLLAPVIRSCEQMTVVTIADRVADLASRARARTLAADDLRAGTFTVSNPGSVGAVAAPAIINQPQVAILGMPTIVKRPVVIAGQDGADAIAIRPIMRLALTFDHRAVDGADATRGLVAIKQRLERWDADAYR